MLLPIRILLFTGCSQPSEGEKMSEKIARREFVKRSMTAAGAGVVLSRGNVHARVLGSNDRINLGVWTVITVHHG